MEERRQVEQGDLRRPSIVWTGFICSTISDQSNEAFYRGMSDEAMRQLKRSRSLRLEQIKATLTRSLAWPGRPGPADIRNRFPLSTRVLASAGILLPAVFCWETWPGLSLGTGRHWRLWHLSQWPESRVSGVLGPGHQTSGQEDNCQESVNRSSYVKLVHNWPGREGGVGKSAETLPSLGTWPTCALVS